MGRRSLSPMLRQQLENLDKGSESRKSAMKVLKSFVEDLDSKAIPLFLAQVSQTKEPNSSSREYTISLYEVLARFHGRNIVPQIENIMSTIIKTLVSSAGSFPLQQACSKVVPAIARYGIEPSTPEDEKPNIIHSLCKPLSDILMGPPDCAASGSALCLKALVECENWRFASNDIVNEVCLKVAGALEEKLTQTNSHMGLAMTLAQRNSLVVEAYARSIIRSGIHMLTGGSLEVNLHKRLTAIQMIKCFIKCVDSRSIYSELETIIDVMEKCQLDSMECVRGAAFEALQTAKIVYVDNGMKLEKDSSSVTGSNFRRRDYSRRRNFRGVGDNSSNGGSRSPRIESPESQTVHSFTENDAFAESPLSIGQASCNFEHGEHTRRRLWKNENGGVDVSLKDGLFSEVGIHSRHFENDQLSKRDRDNSGIFSGFALVDPANANTRSATPSPQRPSQFDIDNVRIFTTPRKLIHSLQDLDEPNSETSEKQANSPNLWQAGRSPRRERNREEFSCKLERNIIESTKSYAGESSESVSSTDYPLGANSRDVLCELGNKEENEITVVGVGSRRRRFGKTAVSLICGFSLLLPAVIMSAVWTGNQDDYFNLVPT